MVTAVANENDPTLLSVTKWWFGIAEEDDAFDKELTIDVDSALSDLRSVGVAFPLGFDATKRISELESVMSPNLYPHVKAYIPLKTKLTFDPPTGIGMTNLQDQVKQLLYRIQMQADL